MTARILIKEEHLAKVAEIVSKVLADEFILYAKTRNAHWNIEGMDFIEMHKFFETQYQELDELVDSVAERIRSIGHYAPATLKSFLQLTHLSEESRQPNDRNGFIRSLLSDHEQVIGYLRENIQPITEKFHDLGTSDFLTGLLTAHEKMAWMLRAHLKKENLID